MASHIECGRCGRHKIARKFDAPATFGLTAYNRHDLIEVKDEYERKTSKPCCWECASYLYDARQAELRMKAKAEREATGAKQGAEMATRPSPEIYADLKETANTMRYFSRGGWFDITFGKVRAIVAEHKPDDTPEGRALVAIFYQLRVNIPARRAVFRPGEFGGDQHDGTRQLFQDVVFQDD